MFLSSEEEDRLLVCGQRESHTRSAAATPEQWQKYTSSGIRWTLCDCCCLSTQNYNFSFQDAHSVASRLPFSQVIFFRTHLWTDNKLLSDHMSRVLRYELVLLLFFYLNCDHDGRFSVWSGWISLYDCKLPALDELQSLDSLGLCLVLITNRWLAGAICWYQSFSFAGSSRCMCVSVYRLMNNDECEVVVVVTTIAHWWIGCYQHHCFDRSMFDIDRYLHTHTLSHRQVQFNIQSQWSIGVVLFFSLTRTLYCVHSNCIESNGIHTSRYRYILILLLLQR